jgi:hypothetical protein
MKIPHLENESKYFLVPVILSAAFTIQITTNTNHGIFTDELYYIACGNHLQYGYVDHSTIAPLLTKVSMLFNKSLTALRFFPASRRTLICYE